MFIIQDKYPLNMKFRTVLFIAIVIMGVCISCVGAIQHDGVLKYDAGDSGKATGTYGMNPWGHAVLFKNPDTITVTGIQVYGCKFGTGDKKIFVEIWDKDLKQLYKDSIELNSISLGEMDINTGNCLSIGSWADIPLPDHVVTGNFYVVVLTYSPKASPTTQGMPLGFTTTSITGTSHTVKENPNVIDDITIANKYSPAAIDWMIRAYYTKSAATPAGTPVMSLTQQYNQTVSTSDPSIISSPTEQISAAPSTKAESTKADIGLCLVVISLVISIILWKKP
jgi:hypothetical protein